jgi:hypothetical protein
MTKERNTENLTFDIPLHILQRMERFPSPPPNRHATSSYERFDQPRVIGITWQILVSTAMSLWKEKITG